MSRPRLRFSTAAAAVLALFAAAALPSQGCGKRCNASDSVCVANALLAEIWKAQNRCKEETGRWCEDFSLLDKYAKLRVEGKFVVQTADSKVFVPPDRSYEIKVKIYRDHLRALISPPPKPAKGKKPPFCIMRRYGEEKTRICTFLI